MTEFLPEKLIEFWFSERVSKLWYNSTPEFDKEVEQKFSLMYQAACDNKLMQWKTTATGCLALILLFDQYPLNVFRNTEKSFATEKQALEIAVYSISQQFEKQLTTSQQSFLYIPFMHSENINHQIRSLELYKSLDPDNYKYAKHHYGIVVKYGRFPHRNSILGRVNSPEEQQYLKSKQAFTG